MWCPVKSVTNRPCAAVVCCAVGVFAVGPHAAFAQEGVRYFEKNGLMYRETTIKIRHPVQKMNYKEITETVNRDQYFTELKPHVRNAYVPVTTYAWEPQMYGKWNPFGQSHVAYRRVPKTSWSVQPQTVQVPVTRRVTTPEKRTRKVPQTSLKYVEREYVKTVPVGPAPTRSPQSTSPQSTSPQSTSQRSDASPTATRNSNDRATANGGATNGSLGDRVGGRTGNTSGLEPNYRRPTQTALPQSQFGGVARLKADPPRDGFSGKN